MRARLVLPSSHSATLRVTLRYRVADPLAVRMVFPGEFGVEPSGPTNAGAVEWVFARQLLAEGLEHRAGVGDVQIQPARGGEVAIELHSTEGFGLLRFGASALRRFLRRTFLAIPEGREQCLLDLDLDRELTRLLA